MPAISGSVPVTGFVAPTDSADTYPSHSEEYGKGGYRSVDTLTDRDAIPAARRKAGMAVKVLANKMEYILGAGLGNGHWEKNPTGSMELGAYSELEALNGSQLVDGSTFFCRYRESQTYGGSGHFYFSSSSTVTADGAMVLAPADNSGRFHRIWEGEPINILWFGAIPSKLVGATLTPAGTFDNSVPINAAINWARTPTYGTCDVRASVLIPAGDFWISNPIVNRYRVDVIGLGCVFSDNEFPTHTTSSSGLISGASRIFLATGANCPMMTWDLSDAATRYTFAYPDDPVLITATITIASPGVITATAHGLTVGRRVGFSTSGALPTGMAALTIYYVHSVPTVDTLTISATSGGAAINTSGSQSGVHTLIKDPTPKYVAGTTIRGVNFYGNGDNQTRNDCHIIDVSYAWNIKIDNCYLGRPRGYMIFARDCNTLDITDCYGNGNSNITSKGVFLFSCADGFMSQSKFGGCAGPSLWVCGRSGWQQQYCGNFLYNNFKDDYTVSGVASNELTTSTAHDFETGMPIELSAASGATLPTLTAYPSIAPDTYTFWAIKVSSTKIKLAYTYEDAIGGTALAITGGSGTFYAWHGAAAGAYLSGRANNNILIGNRCDQNQNFGIALNNATENSITANLCNLNGFNSLTGAAEPTTSAGVYLRNGSANNVVIGNSMMDGGTYAQTYGVWVDSNCGKNYIGQNAYKANPSQVATSISTTGNTTEVAVVNQPSSNAVMQAPTGVTVYADATGSPLTIARSDVPGEWKMELSSVTSVMRIKNSLLGNTAISLNSSASGSSLYLGSTASSVASRSSFIYGEQSSTLSGTDAAAGDFYIAVGTGTGASTTGGKLRIQFPTAGASGTAVQSLVERAAFLREGGLVIHPLTAAPTLGLGPGAIYPNSSDSLFYGRLGTAWHTMSSPNVIGVSLITVDASATFTFTPLTSRWKQLLTAAITANRTVTLSSTLAQQGTQATFTRAASSTGAFNWDIGGLKNLAVGQWCEVGYDGSAWVLLQFGSL